MHDFVYRDNDLYCEDVPIKRISGEVKTPFYLYSLHTLRRHYRVFDKAFEDVPRLICFSTKANSNIAVLKVFVNEGSGLDIVSGGELFRALQAGMNSSRSRSFASDRPRSTATQERTLEKTKCLG